MARRRPGLLLGITFVLPIILLVGFFVYSPLVQAARYSLTNWDGIDPAKSVGLANYRFLLHYSDFHQILINQIVLLLGLIAWVGVPFIIACALHGMRFSGPIRAVLFIPPLLPPVVVGSIFRILLDESGPVNSLLRGIGLAAVAPHWLTGRWTVLFSVILVITWATMGVGVMFYSAALSTLPEELIDSALIDGASWPRVVWHIYRPHLHLVTKTLLLLLTIAATVSFFPWILPLTGGGPGVSSTTLDFAVWGAGVRDGQAGLASAMGIVDVVFVAIVLGTQLLVRRIGRGR